jgi:hypothetical protein
LSNKIVAKRCFGLLNNFKIAKDFLSFCSSSSSKSFSLCEKNAFSEAAQIDEIIKHNIIATKSPTTVGKFSEGISLNIPNPEVNA